MKNSRRSFIKIAGLAALGIGSKPVLNAFAMAEEHGAGAKAATHVGEKALAAKQWGMVIDTRKLEKESDFAPIIAACHDAHNVPNMKEKRHEIKWIWQEDYKHVFAEMESKYLNERVEKLPLLVLCNHCENPSCVRACPTQATFKRADGIVMMDFHRCIGCRFCMAACPYGSRSFNFQDPRPFIDSKKFNPEFPTRMRGVVEKCNFCSERLAVGKLPACVEASKGAIVFGDLEDPASDVRKMLKSNYTIRRKPALGTSPAVYYIV